MSLANRMRLLNNASNAFSIRRPEKEERKRPVPKVAKVYADPEVMDIIQPKIDKADIQLKEGESAILISSFSDPENLRVVKVVQDNTVINDYDVEFIDLHKTKITAKKDITGIVQLHLPLESRYCDLQVEYARTSGIFRLPISLSDDREDLKITSFIVNGKERLKEPIGWEILNMYFITPSGKICKYDYGEMFNKAFAGTRISSHLDPDYVYYETELIQYFEWPITLKWTITVSGNDNFVIDSSKLETPNVQDIGSDIFEWNVSGSWESKWIRINGIEKTVENTGKWVDVVEKMIGPELCCFVNGIICPKSTNFTICLQQNNQLYLFTNS